MNELKIKYEHVVKELEYQRKDSQHSVDDEVRHFKRQALEWEQKYFKRIDVYTELQYDYEKSQHDCFSLREELSILKRQTRELSDLKILHTKGSHEIEILRNRLREVEGELVISLKNQAEHELHDVHDRDHYED